MLSPTPCTKVSPGAAGQPHDSGDWPAGLLNMSLIVFLDIPSLILQYPAVVVCQLASQCHYGRRCTALYFEHARELCDRAAMASDYLPTYLLRT